jgi:hypothetical protein
MAWPLFLVTRQPRLGEEEYRPGACWYDEELLDWQHLLSKRYLSIKDTRMPIVVLIPDGNSLTHFCVDFFPTDNKEGSWQVSGTLPAITITPSINLVGRYHGFIRNGILEDDCEGRRFPKFPSN